MCFFFNDTATTEIYTLSLHDALPISFPPLWPGSSTTTAVEVGGAGTAGTVDVLADGAVGVGVSPAADVVTGAVAVLTDAEHPVARRSAARRSPAPVDVGPPLTSSPPRHPPTGSSFQRVPLDSGLSA